MEETACADEGFEHTKNLCMPPQRERWEFMYMFVCQFSVWQLFQFFSVFPYSNKVVPFQQTENQNQKAIISTLVIHLHMPTSLEEHTVW